MHSYLWGRANEKPLHDLSYIPSMEEIIIDDYEEGAIRKVRLHDGSTIILKKLDKDYDPTNKFQAIEMLTIAEDNHLLMTGLLYIQPEKKVAFDYYNLVDEPLNRLSARRIQPEKTSLERINQVLY